MKKCKKCQEANVLRPPPSQPTLLFYNPIEVATLQPKSSQWKEKGMWKKCCCTCNRSWTSNTAIVITAVLALVLLFFFLVSLVKCLGYKQKKRKEESGEWCHIARELFCGVSCSLALFNSFTLEHRKQETSVHEYKQPWFEFAKSHTQARQYHTAEPQKYQISPEIGSTADLWKEKCNEQKEMLQHNFSRS